jgi:hypothetical protein
MIEKLQKTNLLDKLNEKEKSLIKQLESHPLFDCLPTINWENFIDILIQRRFLSFSIVNVYELVIDALSEEEIKKTVREILKEEFPRTCKGIPLLSHRELLFQDLLNLGATREKILTTPETDVTKKIREESLKIFTQNFDKEYFQVIIVAALRFWAEVLVSVEYSCLWRKISEHLSSPHGDSNKPRSEFYYFHMVHDARRSDLGKEAMIGKRTHSQELAIHLVERLICSENDLNCCLDVEEKACNLKCQFYDQFI